MVVDDPAHWRQRAVEARALADDMRDDISRKTMLKIADDYEHLALRVEERLRRERKRMED